MNSSLLTATNIYKSTKGVSFFYESGAGFFLGGGGGFFGEKTPKQAQNRETMWTDLVDSFLCLTALDD